MPRHKDPIHGFIYQLKLLMLFLQKGVRCKYDFSLGTEIQEAGCFDDLIFKYKQDDKTCFRLLQAKHSLDKKSKITNADLFEGASDQKYCLIKYYYSYMKSKGEKLFEGGSFKDLIICTNADFDFEDLRKYDIEVHEVMDDDDILIIKTGEGETKPKRYRFDEKLADKLQQKLEGYRDAIAAKNLVNFILNNKPLQKTSFRFYANALTYEVIDKKSKKFFDNFVSNTNLSSRASEFRDLFECELRDQSGGELDLTMLQNIIVNKTPFNEKIIKLNIPGAFGNNPKENLWTSKEISREAVLDFLNLLTFAVKINEDELGKGVKNELGDQFNEITTEHTYMKLFQHMIDFLRDKLPKDKEEIKFLTFSEGDDFLKNACFEIMHLRLSGYKNHLDSIQFYFEETLFEKSRSFFNSKVPLWLLTSKTPWLSSLVVYQSFKNYTNVKNLFICKWSDLLDNNGKILLDFKNLDNFLIIVSCLQMIGTKSITAELVKIIERLFIEEKSDLKQIIVIASDRHEVHHQLLEIQHNHQNFYREDLNIKFSDMDTSSQILLFNRENIVFQRTRQLSLQELLDIKDGDLKQQIKLLNLDAEDIELLLRNSEVEMFNQISNFSSLTYKPNKAISFENIIKEIRSNEVDIFTFYGNDDEIKKMFYDQGIDLMRFNNTDSLDKIRMLGIILLEQEREATEFNQLCKMVYDLACTITDQDYIPALHKVKHIGDNKWIWMKTFSVDFYMKRQFKQNDWPQSAENATTMCRKLNTEKDFPNEDALINLNQRITLLADGPCMGKSSFLMLTVQKLKKHKPTSIVIEIDFNKLQRRVDSFSVKSKNQLIELLFRILKKSSTYAIEKKIMKYKMKYPEQFILLFDGFDEVRVEKQESALNLFNFVVQKTKANLWITTRFHDEEKLQSSLNVPTYSFKELSNKEQLGCLINYLNVGSTFSSKDYKSFDPKQLHPVIYHINSALKGKDPLRFQFIIETYIGILEDSEIIDDSTVENKIFQVNLVDATETFVLHMYEIYFVEKIKNVEWFDDDSKAILREAYSNAYRCLAAKLMNNSFRELNFYSTVHSDLKKHFYEGIREKLSLSTLSRIGLIQTYDDENNFTVTGWPSEKNEEMNCVYSPEYDNANVRFIHPLFQFFFATEFVCHQLKAYPSLEILWEFLIDEILSDPFSLKVFDNKLANDEELSSLSSKYDQQEIIFALHIRQNSRFGAPVTLWKAARQGLKRTVTFLSECFLNRDIFPTAMEEVLRLPETFFNSTDLPELIINYIIQKSDEFSDVLNMSMYFVTTRFRHHSASL